jgi:hypothetical protein
LKVFLLGLRRELGVTRTPGQVEDHISGDGCTVLRLWLEFGWFSGAVGEFCLFSVDGDNLNSQRSWKFEQLTRNVSRSMKRRASARIREPGRDDAATGRVALLMPFIVLSEIV